MVEYMDGFTNKGLLQSYELHKKALIETRTVQQEILIDKEVIFFEENKGKRCKILLTNYKGTVYNLVRNDSKQYLTDKYIFQILIEGSIKVPLIMEFPFNVILIIN